MFWLFFFFFNSRFPFPLPILKLLLTRGASLFNSCLEMSTWRIQTAGAAWVAVSDASRDTVGAWSTSSPQPPCSFAPLAGLPRACHGWCLFLEWGPNASELNIFHMFSHLKAFQGEIWDVSFYAHTLNFLCLALDFFNTYADCFQCVLIETGDICIHSIGDDGDLTDTWFELACYF